MSQVQLTPSQQRAIAKELDVGEYRMVKPYTNPDYLTISRQLVLFETDCGFKYSLWLGKRGTWYEYSSGPY